jgi:hypothetical protein
MTTRVVRLVDRPVAFTGQPTCRQESLYVGGIKMATKKKATNKRGKVRDLPKLKKKLTSEQAKAVKGGVRKAGEKPVEYLKIKLTDLLVSS